MATSKAIVTKSSSAVKRSLQGEKRHARNTSVLSRLKTEEKKLRATFGTSGADEVRELYRRFSSALDKAAKKGVIHKNAAARKKGRLNSALGKISKPATELKPKKAAVKKAPATKTKAKVKK